MHEKYVQVMVASQMSVLHLDFIIQNLTKDINYYDNNQALLLRSLEEIKAKLQDALTNDA